MAAQMVSDLISTFGRQKKQRPQAVLLQYNGHQLHHRGCFKKVSSSIHFSGHPANSELFLHRCFFLAYPI